MALRFEASFASAADFLHAYDTELTKRGLLVRGAELAQATPMTPCVVAVQVARTPVAELEAKVAAVVPGVGVAVMLDALPPQLTQAADRLRAGNSLDPPPPAEPPASAESESEPEATGPVTERLKALSVAQKISLALSCDRETRFALLRDHNKSLHVYVLRNPRIGLDEVQSAAKMASLSPEALKLIAEHREWGLNASICTSLVRNPKLLLPLALRLLDRLPVSEVRAIAKGGARDQIVQAARKRLSS